MATTDWVRRTARWSLIAQFVLGLVSLIGFIRLPESDDTFVWSLLVADVAVQVLEASFYIIFTCCIKKILTWYRYIDWYMSTPVMLISYIGFLAYLDDSSLTLTGFTSRYSSDLLFVVLMNSIMLSFGLCSELQWIPTRIAIPLGSIALIATFSAIYVRVGYATVGGALFLTFVFIIWLLYGVAACLSYTSKNVMYNVLDIVSKNLYGVLVAIFFLLHSN